MYVCGKKGFSMEKADGPFWKEDNFQLKYARNTPKKDLMLIYIVLDR